MAKAFYRADNFQAQNSVGCLIRRLNNLMTPRAEARFADEELTFSHWVTLMCLRDGLASTCADIARHMNHDSGATTRLVDQLEKRGLLTRSRSKTDRRVVHLTLTADGKAMAKALAPRTMNFWNDMLDGFTTAEAGMLIEMLTRLLQRMEATPVDYPKSKAA
jgi:DNA-binding MarR family transcriptional regulator